MITDIHTSLLHFISEFKMKESLDFEDFDDFTKT